MQRENEALRTERDELKQENKLWLEQHSEACTKIVRLGKERDELKSECVVQSNEASRVQHESVKDRAAMKLALEGLTKTVWSDGKERWIVDEKQLNIAITALRGRIGGES